MKTLSWSAAVALLALVVCVPNASAEPTKCKKAIAKTSSQFVQAKAKALAKCEEAVVKTGLGGPCPDAKATAAISKAETKMRSTIDKTCGGDDKLCGGNLTDEDTPPSVGWPLTCPNFESGACNNAISDCGDIADCLACIDEAAVDQAINLYYDDLVGGTVGQKPLNPCQVSIGKATSAFLNAKSKALQKCWDARLAGKHNLDCISPSVGDGKYLAAIAKAETKKITTICKACGGADKACGGGDDLTPAAIGFQANCPSVTIPGGAACGGAITDLQSIVDCVDCVTEYKVDCIDRLQVPDFTPYPSECNGAPPGCMLPPPSGPCPSAIQFTADGAAVDLDTGFTGLAHDATVPSNGRLTLSVDTCDNANYPCGECQVSGPLDNGGGAAFQNKRCTDQSWVQCATDTDCINAGALGPCVYFFGAPLPLRAGGVSTCVMNRIAAPVSGSINLDDGSSISNVPLSSIVATSGAEFTPCPTCEAGLCTDGPRIGQACTVNGNSVLYGDVSLDCPFSSGAVVATLAINLDIATGTQSVTVSAANPRCRQFGFGSLQCLCDTCNNLAADSCATNADCPANGGGPGICGGKRCQGGVLSGNPCLQCIGGTNHGANCTNSSACPGGTCPDVCGTCVGGVNIGNNCNSNAQCPGSTCTSQCNRPGQDTKPHECQEVDGCVDVGGNEGECVAGPVELYCSIQTFRSCSINDDCNPPGCPNCVPGQTCIPITRKCFTGNGVIGESVLVSGEADAPCGGISEPTVGSFFCVAPVGQTAVNAASGLPGLGRVRIPGEVVVIP